MSDPVSFRQGTPEESYAVFYLFEQTLADLTRRFGSTDSTSVADTRELEKMWRRRQSLYDYLARAADQFWIAERSGEMIGFARSILRGDLQQLTEFFILPGEQSSGVGKELLSRAFPRIGARHRLIIATMDLRAQALYLKNGVYPRFPLFYFRRKPEAVDFSTDLAFQPMQKTAQDFAALGELDQEILAHRRDEEHSWLMDDRQGFLYTRAGVPVGYGYLGISNGPFALRDPADFPAVLGHAERVASENEREWIGFEVPMINRSVVDYLLAQNYQIDDFMALWMSDEPFGKLARYIVTSPPFFL